MTIKLNMSLGEMAARTLLVWLH